MIIIQEIIEEKKKAEITDEILHQLPDWFGIEESTQGYIRDSKKMVYFAAYDEEQTVGFLAINPTSRYTAEIYVMGIKTEYHRMGIGRQLFQTCYQWCREHHYEYLQVKTLDYSSADPNYAKTRKYYETMGFRPLECFPTLWGECNPCLVMIQKI
ncbi:GNAT family N-acetyltransferase [Anaerosporobacter faecicola]|uniref:GNAT family N-acetyltransferase n=1 Tax=Anaerosporobacter faecicola TaxID=2718714 RepID=UPI00143B41D2|nr:GNAT family N-acetyltransferase [Anaerosporobacter faecicola]